MKKPTSKNYKGIKEGYKSGLEEKIAKQISDKGFKVQYETAVLDYIDPMVHKYHPDFVLPNNITIETKGRFLPKDRRKHLLIKKQYPDMDLRFVFNNSKAKLSKKSKTTYADWCIKNGFKFADKLIPDEWFNE
jgi:hypothetical protein